MRIVLVRIAVHVHIPTNPIFRSFGLLHPVPPAPTSTVHPDPAILNIVCNIYRAYARVVSDDIEARPIGPLLAVFILDIS